MACCTGQTDCNHIITIGYLKTFTNGLIQNGSGTAQSVDLSSLPTSARTDSYCPTYAQLTGGTLIPIFVNAGSHKWSQNTDGITINGAYDNTQCVKQEDLVATYTRFESLTVTATPSVNISECGGSSTMSYTYTLRKYVKSMDTACTVSTTSTTDTDTTDSGNAAIVYTTNQTWATVSKPTITLAKNGTHDSPARTVTVTGTINFRGTSHSATATIGQKALTGDYKFWYHTYEIYSYDSVSISPDYFDCNGGTWEATGYYTNHDWDVYRWQDSCGVNYDSDTDNRNHTYPSYTELYTSGSADTIDCEAISEKFVTGGTVDYHGNTASWTQECESCSGDCPCGETCRFDTIHSGGTIPCTGGSVDIKYDYIVKSVTCDPSTGQRTETITDSGTNLTWATVHADGCNKTSDTIGYEYNVIQEAGPCCPTGDVFTFDDVEIACTGAAATSQNVKYTQVHTNPDTTTTTTTGTTSKSIPGADCNATSNRKLLQAGVIGSTLDAAQPAVYQAAGPCCPTGDVFTFDDVTVDCYASAATTTSVTYTQVHTNPDTTKTTTTGTTSKSIPARECNPNATTRVIQVGNTGTTLATANPKVTQAAGPCCCSCSDFGLGNETLSWTYNETATKTKTYTAGTCISDVVATSNDNWFSVTALTNGNINVTPSGQNTTTSVKNATITVSFNANGSSCTSKTFTVTQAAYGCTCADLTIASTPGAWSWNDASTKSASLTVNSECITNIVPTSDNNWFTTSLIGNNVNVTPSGNNTTLTAKTATITVSYSSNGTPCSDTFAVSQDAAPCQSAECVCYVVGTATANTVSSTATFETVKWPYSAITWTTGYSCDVSSAYTSSGESTQIVKFSQATCENHTKSGSFTWTGYTACGSDGCSSSDVVVNWFINQEKPASCDCTCNDLTIVSTPGAWSWNDTSTKGASLTVNSECITNIVPTSDNNWFTTSLVGNNVNITPSGNNTTSAAKTATITVSYSSNGTPCSDTFVVSQDGALCPSAECTCYIVGAATASTVTSTATSTTVTWPYSAITWTTGYSCDVSSAYTSSGESTQTVTFAAATCDDYTKSGSFSWTGHKACGSNGCSSSDVSVSWSITQTRPPECDCDCDNLTISSSAESWTYDSTTSKTITITSSNCISNISLVTTGLTKFNASLTTNGISVSPKRVNTAQTVFEESFILEYNSGTLSCSKQITLTQTGAPCASAECTCYIVGAATANTVSSIATTATVTWPYTAVTNTTAYTCGESSVSSTGTSSTTVMFEAATCEDYTKSGSFPWTGYKLCDANSACTNTDATINWSITQEIPPNCDCDCGSLALSPTALTWAASSTAVTDINVTSASCVSGITLNTPSHFSATTVNGKIQVNPRSTNTGLTDIVQTLTVNYSYDGATATTDSSSVDLGLPSGLLWSKTNVGASSESDYGNYYQYGWGSDTYPATPHSMYSGTENPLAASADSATQVLGSEWHTPTASEFQELVNNTTYQWTTINGVRGTKFTAQNGNYIFFPAAGIWDTGALQAEGQYSFCWTSTPNNSSSAKMYMIGSGGASTGSTVRVDAISVRGVKAATAVTSCSSAITLTHQAASCDCANANMSYTFNGAGSSSSNRVPATGGTVTLTYSTNCGDGYILSSSDINGSSVSYIRSTNTIRITVPSTLSTTGKTYTEYLSYASNGNSCISFTIYQSAYVEECNCSNSDFVMYDAIIPWSGGEQVCIATYAAKCTDNLTFSITGNSASAVTNITTASTGTQYGHAIYGDVTRNYDLYSQRSFTITARFDGSFCQSVTSYQEVGKCECEKFGFSGTSSTSTTLDLGYIAGSRNEVTLVGHENMQSIDVIIDGEDTWLSYFKNGDTIVFSATTENDSMNSRIAAVQIIERNTDIGDCIRSITIVQAAKPIKKCPYCSIFTDEYDWGDEATIHNQ